MAWSEVTFALQGDRCSRLDDCDNICFRGWLVCWVTVDGWCCVYLLASGVFSALLCFVLCDVWGCSVVLCFVYVLGCPNL